MGKVIKVRCPRCGFTFIHEVSRERPKGAGAWYGREITRLTELHEEILRVLYEEGPSTKRRLGGLLADRGRRVSGNSLSGRLSELAGAGYVRCEWTEVRVYDEEARQFRFVKKPVWFLTEKGIQYLREKGLAG